MAAEHLCVTCSQLRQGEPRIYDRKQCCEGCRARLRSLIREIEEHYDALSDHLARGNGVGQRVSGSREAPLPLRIDPLDLMLPARVPNPTAEARKWPTDQLGRLSVASVLDFWVDDWRQHRRKGECQPRATVYVLAAWLLERLDDACDDHPAIDDFAQEMRELASVLRRTVGANDVQPERLDAPCRRCDLLDLHRLPGEDRIECGSCGELLTEDEYRRWVGLVAADVKESVG